MLSTAAHRHDVIRVRARAGLRGAGRRGRRRLVRRVGPRSRQVPAHRTRRRRACDRRAEHVRGRTVARTAYGHPQDPRPGRSERRKEPTASSSRRTTTSTISGAPTCPARCPSASRRRSAAATSCSSATPCATGISGSCSAACGATSLSPTGRGRCVRIQAGRARAVAPTRRRSLRIAARVVHRSAGGRRGRARRLGSVTATETPVLAAPFRGLAPFRDTELDALLFFGRERETEIAVANLLASRLTILYGPTGVGKSSLLRSGRARRVHELAAGDRPWPGQRSDRILGLGGRAGGRARGGDRRRGDRSHRARGAAPAAGHVACRCRRALGGRPGRRPLSRARPARGVLRLQRERRSTIVRPSTSGDRAPSTPACERSSVAARRRTRAARRVQGQPAESVRELPSARQARPRRRDRRHQGPHPAVERDGPRGGTRRDRAAARRGRAGPGCCDGGAGPGRAAVPPAGARAPVERGAGTRVPNAASCDAGRARRCGRNRA